LNAPFGSLSENWEKSTCAANHLSDGLEESLLPSLRNLPRFDSEASHALSCLNVLYLWVD
jgi:hypothetical protein